MRFTIIDDEHADRVLVRHVLGRVFGDVSIEEFSDPERAVEALRTTPPVDDEPHVILLDINMPRMSGWGVLGKLQGSLDCPPRHVVMLSSSNRSADKVRASNFSCVAGYKVKPLRRADAESLRLVGMAGSTTI